MSTLRNTGTYDYYGIIIITVDQQFLYQHIIEYLSPPLFYLEIHLSIIL